jgi:hypothetical protein
MDPLDHSMPRLGPEPRRVDPHELEMTVVTWKA